MISFVITELFLFGLSLGVSGFITMAYTHTTIHTVPHLPAIIGAVILYIIRLIILYVIRENLKTHYKRLRADDHIKVFTEPKKNNLWKWLMGLFVIAVVLFLTLQCANYDGFKDFKMPIEIKYD